MVALEGALGSQSWVGEGSEMCPNFQQVCTHMHNFPTLSMAPTSVHGLLASLFNDLPTEFLPFSFSGCSDLKGTERAIWVVFAGFVGLVPGRGGRQPARGDRWTYPGAHWATRRAPARFGIDAMQRGLIVGIPTISQRYPNDIPTISLTSPQRYPIVRTSFALTSPNESQRYPNDIPRYPTISQRNPRGRQKYFDTCGGLCAARHHITVMSLTPPALGGQ